MRETAFFGTTILSVRRGEEVAIGGDGQVTMGDVVCKHHARKIRSLEKGKVLVGFAGSVGDAMALLERFENKLKEHQGNTLKAAIALAKDWRTDKMLRPLESILCVVDKTYSLILSGSGEVIQPDDGVIGIGSGGPYAVAAARALLRHSKLSAKEIVEEALKIAADICIFTNREIYVEEISS